MVAIANRKCIHCTFGVHFNHSANFLHATHVVQSGKVATIGTHEIPLGPFTLLILRDLRCQVGEKFLLFFTQPFHAYF